MSVLVFLILIKLHEMTKFLVFNSWGVKHYLLSQLVLKTFHSVSSHNTVAQLVPFSYCFWEIWLPVLFLCRVRNLIWLRIVLGIFRHIICSFEALKFLIYNLPASSWRNKISVFVDGWNESFWYLKKKGQPEFFPALCQGWQVQSLKHVCHAPWCARCVVTGYKPRCSSLDFFKSVYVTL